MLYFVGLLSYKIKEWKLKTLQTKIKLTRQILLGFFSLTKCLGVLTTIILQSNYYFMNKKETSNQALQILMASYERILKQYLLDSEEWRKQHCEYSEEKHLISKCPKTKIKGFKLLIHNLQKLWK